MLFEGLLAAVLILLDQLTKYLARTRLSLGEARTLLPGLLGLRCSENTGAAFSSFSENTALLTLLSALLVAGLLAFLLVRRSEPGRIRLPIVLLLAGGAGNLIDRLLRGSVTDFLELLFVRFAIFNVADVLVTAGAIWLAISVLFLTKGGSDGAK